MQDQTLATWNWGAFTFTWVWAFGMRLWMVAVPLVLINLACYSVVTMQLWVGTAVQTTETAPQAEQLGHVHGETAAASAVPVMSTSVMQAVLLAVIATVLAGIVLGFVGNRLAWKSRNWNGLLHFRVTQIAWEKYGRPIGIAVLTIVPMYFILSKFAS